VVISLREKSPEALAADPDVRAALAKNQKKAALLESLQALASHPEVRAALARIPREEAPVSNRKRVFADPESNKPEEQLQSEVEGLRRRIRLIRRKRTLEKQLASHWIEPRKMIEMEATLSGLLKEVSLVQLRSGCRKQWLVNYRFEAYRLLREAGHTFVKIGIFLNRDRGAVLHGILVLAKRRDS
jgi:hypothetical protein